MILKVGQALAVSALIFSAAAPAHAEDVNITYAAFGPPTSTVVREGIVPFLDAMKDKSGGSITYTLHSGGSLAGATSMLDSIADGTADGGQVLTILNQPKLPLNAIVIGLAPAMTGDPVTLAAALTDYVLTGCPQCRKEYEDNNVVFLGAFATTRYQMLCREPVNGLADMKDKRVRASGDWGQLATALGATPVNMAVSEVYEGLQRGVLDCAAAPASWLKSYSLSEITKHIYETESGAAYDGPVLDLSVDVWNKLDDDQKAAAKSAAAEAVVKVARAYVEDDRVALEEARAANADIVPADEQTRQALSGLLATMRATLMERANKLDIAGAEEALDGFQASVDKWSAIVAKAKSDDEIAAALMSEVYSKM